MSAARPTAAVLLMLSAAILPLAGCSKAARRPRLPPALSSVLAGGDALNAAGEAPLWSLQIRPKALSFSTEGGAPTVLANPGAAQAPNGAVWAAPGPGGRAFRAAITAKPCRDAETELSFPFTAEVSFGASIYHGCAAAAGQGLGPRG